MQYRQRRWQQRRATQQCPRVPRRIVAASDDTWRIEIKCAFPGPKATRSCISFTYFILSLTVPVEFSAAARNIDTCQ